MVWSCGDEDAETYPVHSFANVGHGTAGRSVHRRERRRFDSREPGYFRIMLYTILIILAIVALVLFIFGRRRV